MVSILFDLEYVFCTFFLSSNASLIGIKIIFTKCLFLLIKRIIFKTFPWRILPHFYVTFSLESSPIFTTKSINKIFLKIMFFYIRLLTVIFSILFHVYKKIDSKTDKEIEIYFWGHIELLYQLNSYWVYEFFICVVDFSTFLWVWLIHISVYHKKLFGEFFIGKRNESRLR